MGGGRLRFRSRLVTFVSGTVLGADFVYGLRRHFPGARRICVLLSLSLLAGPVNGNGRDFDCKWALK